MSSDEELRAVGRMVEEYGRIKTRRLLLGEETKRIGETLSHFLWELVNHPEKAHMGTEQIEALDAKRLGGLLEEIQEIYRRQAQLEANLGEFGLKLQT